jgi:hypothetical protein
VLVPGLAKHKWKKEDRFPIVPLRVAEMKFQRNRRVPGSIPVLGSSKNTARGLLSIDIATLSLRLFPPEYVPTYNSTRTMTTKSADSFIGWRRVSADSFIG